MAEIIKDDDLDLDDIDDELDNDEGYDLDGDPDEDIDTDIDDEETDDAEADDGEDELDETETDENDDETDAEGDESDKDDPAAESATDDRDAQIEELRKQLAAKDATIDNIRNLSKETLQKMGVKVDGSVEEALEKANAESEGISVEDYRKARAATAEAQAAERQAKQQAFEALAAADLSELKKSFPDLLKQTHIKDCFDSMADFVQFGKLRDSGVEPKTAYLAVNGDKVRTKQAAAAQQKAASGGKEHLNSAVSKKASGNNTVTVIKTKSFKNSSAKVKVRTNKKPYVQIARINNAIFSFEDLDFSDLTFNTTEQSLFAIKEKEKQWVEKQYYLFSDEYLKPFALFSISYRYRVAGRYKG